MTAAAAPTRVLPNIQKRARSHRYNSARAFNYGEVRAHIVAKSARVPTVAKSARAFTPLSLSFIRGNQRDLPLSICMLVCLVHFDDTVDFPHEPEAGEKADGACG